jgi:hypothetical protein
MHHVRVEPLQGDVPMPVTMEVRGSRQMVSPGMLPGAGAQACLGGHHDFVANENVTRNIGGHFV